MAVKSPKPGLFYASVVWTKEESCEVFIGEGKAFKGILSSSAGLGCMNESLIPEEFLLMSLAYCTMLTYLYFVNANGIDLVSYDNSIIGTLTKGKDGYSLTHYEISSKIKVKKNTLTKANEACDLTKRFCLIANSLSGEKNYINEVIGVD